jgi:hypothetical protein
MTFAPNFLWNPVDPKGKFSSQKAERSAAQLPLNTRYIPQGKLERTGTEKVFFK